MVSVQRLLGLNDNVTPWTLGPDACRPVASLVFDEQERRRNDLTARRTPPEYRLIGFHDEGEGSV